MLKIIQAQFARWKAAHKQRRFDRASEVLREFGCTPARIVQIAGSAFIVGADGNYYRIGEKQAKPSPHHKHEPILAPKKAKKGKSS